MTKQEAVRVLFVQGGGDDGYAADEAMVASLRAALGNGYRVEYPLLRSDEGAADFGWPQQIGEKLAKAGDGVVVVGHSLGASMTLKFLSKNDVRPALAGVFLLATPFWGADEDWQAGLKLREGFAERLPAGVPIVMYHCRDDEVVPFAHFGRYQQELPQATFRKVSRGGHQFGDDLAMVAADIRALEG